jgi:single-strand DNA-binding protein
MANNNVITLVGNITDDPELRFTPGGAAVANFTVAVNQRRQSQSGAWEDRLDGFFRCNCWRDLAENVAESLQKGSRVVVVGRLQQRSWEDQEGNRRSVVEVQVDDVGPSLRWATANVQKLTRTTARQGQGGDWGGSRPEAQGGEARPAGAGADRERPPGDGGDWGARPAPVGPPEEGGF